MRPSLRGLPNPELPPLPFGFPALRRFACILRVAIVFSLLPLRVLAPFCVVVLRESFDDLELDRVTPSFVSD
jgi:hypothetical protein